MSTSSNGNILGGDNTRGNSNRLYIELADLLNIKEIDDTTLQVCIKLIDQGIDPQQLATYILKINNETRSVLS